MAGPLETNSPQSKSIAISIDQKGTPQPNIAQNSQALGSQKVLIQYFQTLSSSSTIPLTQGATYGSALNIATNEKILLQGQPAITYTNIIIQDNTKVIGNKTAPSQSKVLSST